MTADYTRFKGMRGPKTDFEAVANELQTLPFYYDVDLTNARSIAAGTALLLPISGNVCYIDQVTSTGSARIAFQDNVFAGVTPITAFPGFIAKIPFTQLQIENDAQPNLRLRIIYGTDLDFTPAIGAGVFGNISVVDGGKARTLAGLTYIGSEVLGNSPGNYTHAQLWNPSGSATNVVLEKIRYGANIAGIMKVTRHNAALTSSFGNISSKYVNTLSASNAQFRYQYAAAPIGVTSPVIEATPVAANASNQLLEFAEPIVIPPSQGVIVLLATVNAEVYAGFEFYEETR